MADLRDYDLDSGSGTLDNTYSMKADKLGLIQAVEVQPSDIVKIGTGLNTMLMETGDWDMVANGSLAINHGLADGKIRAMFVEIKNDVTTATVPLNAVLTETTPAIQGGIGSTTGGITTLWRSATGSFNSSVYDQTSFNRGDVTILYID